ncbi:taste receptor type 2 member 7-like [Bombina bombina]|uniref:taste receptor type 2 member 7-like n=1 Tax=Bombina bombina TaxID=8345 RepID=UPI00235A483B|nr:taste receptor type 2 member 7-like [Bombina bombina]
MTMLSTAWKVLLIIFTAITSVSGISSNSFIMIVTYLKHKRFLKLSPRNQIQFTMCLNNLLLQCSTVLFILVMFLIPDVQRELRQVASFVLCLFMAFGSWLAAWLCAFYTVIVVRFRHKVITSLKMKLPSLVPKLLLVTFLGCLSITVPSIWYLNSETAQNMTGNLTYSNISDTHVFHQSDWHYLVIFHTLGTILPVVISIISLVLTVTSLLGHIWRIKHNDSSWNRPLNVAHYKACRTIFLFVAVFVIIVVVGIIFVSKNGIQNFMLVLKAQIYPTELSFILISGSSKVKRALYRVVPCTSQ